jgi:tetratricopeptide (TPR) repeat protein
MRRSQFRESYGPSIAAGEAAARAGRPDLAYGCWANVAAAASAAGEHERALEFVARAGSLAAQGLQSLEVHMLSIRAAVLTRMARFDEAFAATAAGQELAEQVGDPGLIAMVAHDRGMVALQAGRHADAAELLARALLEDAPASRPQTWIALAEAHVRAGAPEEAEHALREAVLEPVRPSDFPEALVPALTRVQGLLAGARGDHELACGRLQEAVAGWERLVGRAGGVDVASVLADLGRPGVGIIDPSYELGRARADLNRIQEETDALVP